MKLNLGMLRHEVDLISRWGWFKCPFSVLLSFIAISTAGESFSTISLLLRRTLLFLEVFWALVFLEASSSRTSGGITGILGLRLVSAFPSNVVRAQVVEGAEWILLGLLSSLSCCSFKMLDNLKIFIFKIFYFKIKKIYQTSVFNWKGRFPYCLVSLPPPPPQPSPLLAQSDISHLQF